MDLKEAIKVLVEDEFIGDFIYNVRERTYEDSNFRGNSWDHPRVKRYGNAVAFLENWLKNEEANKEQ